MSYFFREATQADLPEIVTIYNSTIAARSSTADLQPVSVAQRQAWFDAHGGSRPIYVLAEGSGCIAAWGSFSDYYPRRAYHISAEISIYVRQEQRGGGLGAQLLENMLAAAPKLGIRNVLAVVFAHNQASIALFERFGFQTWGRLPQVCDLETKLADIVILGKCLDTV
ncbi:N-acetyltransferase family protein [Neisseria sp. ZJ106]|uniref:GNAT family N-acetyltransferase n=1 Tax=Neisseria lisongii TaxID=2912188 RepID=A0ABY7RK27_9NEIS|nr:GNAT family N-acetyltransferase [Neisseria lisongii]MCF7520490.1 N-acetyltransferase family protein [Neisseria lisongii]WCL71568.1 GNAT family N-acetyltransferase [Neisseria lisongii]